MSVGDKAKNAAESTKGAVKEAAGRGRATARLRPKARRSGARVM